MLFLSIFPSHKNAQQLDPHRPILPSLPSTSASTTSDETRRHSSRGTLALQKRVSFSSPSGRPSDRLNIRLAAPDVLLPFIDRPREVEDLLNTTKSGAALFKALETAHCHRVTSAGNKEWDTLEHLLTRVDRDQLKDRQWLQRLHVLVFANSPSLWCQLAECLGAREVTLYPERQQQQASDEQHDVPLLSPTSELFSPLSSPMTQDESDLSQSGHWQQLEKPNWATTTFESLVEVPDTFIKPSNTINCISSRADEDAAAHRTNDAQSLRPDRRRTSINLSACDADEVASILAVHRHAFAGLRIGLPSDDNNGLAPSLSIKSTASPIERMNEHPHAIRRSRATSEGGGLLFSRQRRLSQLHAVPPARALIQDKAVEQQRTNNTSHRRSSSLTSNPSEVARAPRTLYRAPMTDNSGSGLSSPWARIERQRAQHRRSQSENTQGPTSTPPTHAREESKCNTGGSSSFEQMSSLRPRSLPAPATRLGMNPSLLTANNKKRRNSTTNPEQSVGSLPILSANEESENLAGLLPDGRTRHPSAGMQDNASKVALKKFRDDLRLSRKGDSVSGSGISTPSSGQSDDDKSLKTPGQSIVFTEASPRSDFSEASPRTPYDVSSMLAAPSIVSDKTPISGHPAAIMTASSPPPSFFNLSPSLSMKPLKPTLDFHPDRSMPSFSTSMLGLSEVVQDLPPAPHSALKVTTNAFPTRSAPPPQSPSSSIIFPIPPNTRFSRVQQLLNDLDAEQERFGDAWHKLCEAIGVRGVEHIRKTIEGAGERTKTPDETLLRRLAGACFGLVDMDMAVMPSQRNSRPNTSGGITLSIEQQLRDKPWYAHHNVRRSRSRSDAEHERFGEMAPLQDLDIINVSSSADDANADEGDDDDGISHEARLQAYYDDMDGYEERWQAFHALIAQVWHIDESVIHKIRLRCGPVAQLDVRRRDTSSSSSSSLSKSTQQSQPTAPQVSK